VREAKNAYQKAGFVMEYLIAENMMTVMKRIAVI
jgi:hypothetical protein